jgi:D-glycero-alpha-D-manno-heptose-7-phosphate kinase
MIVVRTPFRISFAGGGSDLPGFYRRNFGAVVSTTIDKAMYIAIHPYFHNKIRIKYSQTEDVDSVAEIRHPLVRECLKLFHLERGMEIASFADVPAGTGMGSSSAFTVCLLHALYGLGSREVTPEQLAREACHLEIDRLGEPIGKQDQYAAAYGGLNYIRFNKDETVEVEPIRCSVETRENLQRQLMLFYVGQERPAGSILAAQAQNMANDEKYGRVERMVELAGAMQEALERNQVDQLGEIVHQGWLLKSGLADGISNPSVETNYRLAREAGASGGKLLGAGGGGFLLILCRPERQPEVRSALSHLREMSFQMSPQGSTVLFRDESNAAGVARPRMLSVQA